MFDTLIVQPIFNLLVFIYGVLPGHDFGIAVILFTVVIRFLMWPLMRKQLHNTRALRAIQPDIKKIRAKNKGNKQREAELLMELYREKGISPFSSLGTLLVQLPILIGLFQAVRKLIDDPNSVVTFSYGFVQDLPFIQSIAEDITLFDKTFVGVIDLSRRAFEDGTIYVPLMIVALLAAVLQYYQAKQMSPDEGEKKKLRDILKESAEGKEADQADINAAMGRNMRVIFPVLTGVFAATFPGSLALYWTAGSAIGLLQNQYALRGDVEEMQEVADKTEEKKPKKKAAASSKKKPATGAKKKSRAQRKKGGE